ncbi:MAG: ABC transporter ATP-binding protein [Candidatus Hydrogenedentota bacterium]
MNSLIEVKNLEVRFDLKEGTVHAVNGVTLDVGHNRSLGIVGESGCGKSITAKAMMRILPSRAKIVRGTIHLASRNGGRPIDLTRYRANAKELRAIRGSDISMIFQEPMTSLSPVHTVGNQIIETIRLHQKVNKKEARNRAIEMLRLVGVPLPKRRVDAYPHELSGGLRQRSMIAMALACHPRLLIADEPTTALDVTIQAQILALIARLREEFGMSVIMITHDLGVVAETTDEVAVMYLGLVVERGPVREIFNNPKHPYTIALLESIPRIGKGNKERLASIKGSVPDPFSTPPGCPFHPRCKYAIKGECTMGAPPVVRSIDAHHTVACHLFTESGTVSEEPMD